MKSTEAQEDVTAKGCPTGDTDDEDDEYIFRRLLEKFVYAMNIRTIVMALRRTVRTVYPESIH